jgi:glyoxylase-like metal-dependent hydrolase (beta-lactamase superfamily II)
MKILNCASMSPWWPRWHVGGICLLVDTDQGPVLVDTGLGLHDHESPSRLVRFFGTVFGIHDAPEETAARQVARLGIDPQDIRHIVLTHLHFDHAGGLPDFPWAQVHLHRWEYEALQHPKTWIERFAYDRLDFVHQPHWVLYEHAADKWFDFDAIRLPFSPRMFLIPLFGHTSGQCGVAIQDGDGWLFQAADALPINTQFEIIPFYLSRLLIGPHVLRLQTFAAAHPEVKLLAGYAFREFFDG